MKRLEEVVRRGRGGELGMSDEGIEAEGEVWERSRCDSY